MRIKLRSSGETVPVFGMLDRGLLIPDPGSSGLCLAAVGEYEAVDVRRSDFWTENSGDSAFAEFFEPWFSRNLENGAPREKFVFESYLALFDREFPRDDLILPKYYGNGLIMCPYCGRISRPLSFLGVIRCPDPKCGASLNNPFHDPGRICESIEWGRLSHLAGNRGQYYCPQMGRYYPSPPGRMALLYERFSERLLDFLRRHRPRRGQEK